MNWGTPIAELEIDTPFVYNLLAEQHSDLLHLPISFLDSGYKRASVGLS